MPVALFLLSVPACVGDGHEPEPGGDGSSVSELALESALLGGAVLRGSVLNGTGCRVLGEPIVQDHSITLVLADYVAALNGTGIARASCDLLFEIELPDGFSTWVDAITYRGSGEGRGGRTQLFREYFLGDVFQGDRRFTIVDYPASGSPVVLQDDSDRYTSEAGVFTAIDESQISLCGGERWRVNTSLSVRNTGPTSSTTISFDTVDGAEPLSITFQFQRPFACVAGT